MPTRFVTVAFTVVALALPALADEIVLKPRFEPGDSYQLSLRATTSTETSLTGGAEKAFHENVQLEYETTVEVLEVDAAGQPVRERHHDVELTYMRPQESGSLFRKAIFQVRRANGEIRIFVRGERVEPRIEKLIAGVLSNQFEHTLGPALFAPGRPVEVGESWVLDPSLARRFLRERGLHGVELSEPATATLEQRGDGTASERVVHFSIPIARFELSGLPENARTAGSQARYAGEIRLSRDPGGSPVAFSSNLDMSVQGVVPAPRVASSVPWSFQRLQISEQQTQRVESTFVSGL